MHTQWLVVAHDPEPDQLPAMLRRCFSPRDLQALRTGPPKYFGQLARKAKPAWLRKILTACADCGGWNLEFRRVNNEPFVTYFRFYWGGTAGFCLPNGKPAVRPLPAVLEHFYSLVGGFGESDGNDAGRIIRATDLGYLDPTKLPPIDAGGVDLRKAAAFLETLSGDYLCFLPDATGFWLKDFSRVERVKNLEKEMGHYFMGLINGTEL